MSPRGRWDRWKPTPPVFAAFVSGGISLWVVFIIWRIYDVLIHPVDVAWNTVIFVTLVVWWTDRMRDKDR